MERNLYEQEHEDFRQMVRAFMEKEVAPHTEEWIDEPVRTRSIPPRRHHAAPAGDKRVKLIKGN